MTLYVVIKETNPGDVRIERLAFNKAPIRHQALLKDDGGCPDVRYRRPMSDTDI